MSDIQDYEEQCDLIDSVSKLTADLTALKKELAVMKRALGLACEACGQGKSSFKSAALRVAHFTAKAREEG